jgi:hypothetical protein
VYLICPHFHMQLLLYGAASAAYPTHLLHVYV